MMRILIFKLGAIGDIIMSTPFVRQLRKDYPDAKIDYAAGAVASRVLEDNKNIDEIITFEEKIFFSKNILGWTKLINKIRKRKYDIVFVLDKHNLCNMTGRFFGAKQVIGFNRFGKEGKFLTKKVYYDGKKHEIFFYLDLLKAFGGKVDYKDIGPEIFLSKKDIEFANLIFKKNKLKTKTTVCIAPGGAKNIYQKMSVKVWPREYYVELIKRLISKNKKIILIGDHNDEEIAKYILKNSDIKENKIMKKIIDLTGKTTIKQTGAIMKNSSWIICNDSGPMHIASAVNHKIISIFGPTDPRRFAPLHKESRYIWKHSRFKCSPCNSVYGDFKKCAHQECMHAIKPDEVIKLIKK